MYLNILLIHDDTILYGWICELLTISFLAFRGFDYSRKKLLVLFCCSRYILSTIRGFRIQTHISPNLYVYLYFIIKSDFIAEKLSLTMDITSNEPLLGNSMSNHPMISPTISDLPQTLHTASTLLVLYILKVAAHSIRYFSRNLILNFQKFQNRTF